MNWSTGCAFTLNHVIMNLPFNKLSFSCQDSYNITGDLHRQVLVKRIFRDCVYIILKDIVDNNVTFWLPVYGSRKCNIHMRRYCGEEFQALRRGGKWQDVDILDSNFTGYQMQLFMLGNRTPRTKSIYLNKELRDLITKKTNEGFQYGDGKTDTTIKDYYEQMYALYPTIPKNDIKRILVFTWKSVYLHNSYGGDVIIHNKQFWCYMGNLKKNPLDHFTYYINKLIIKIRVLYKRKKPEWDGYYYFALGDKQYEEFSKQVKKRGRPRKYFKLTNIILYQILDECRLAQHQLRYIFRIKIPYKTTTTKYYEELITDNVELIQERDPMKFKDVLISENNYDIL